MKLIIVPPDYVYQAWEKEGADCLSEVCNMTEEITGDQLKFILARGERTLVRMDEEDKTVGWGCIRVDPLPNIRVLHITDLVCHNGGFERFFEEVKDIAKRLGCSQIRCCAHPAQARLYRMKCGFEPVYATLKVQL